MRFLLTGDWHLTSENPISRKDNYAEAMHDKITQISSICKGKNVDCLVMAGDLFHKTRNTFEYVNSVMDAVSGIPCRKLMITGNHDVMYGNSDLVDKTPIGILYKTGYFEHLTHVAFPLNDKGLCVNLCGVDFATDASIPTANFGSNSINMIVVHAFVGNDEVVRDEYFSLKEFKEKGWHVVVAGHDHVEYPALFDGGETGSECNLPVVFRPGALSRGTKHISNRVKDVNVTILDINEEGLKYEIIKLNVRDSADIFSAMEINAGEVNTKIKDFVRKLSSNNVSTVGDIKSVLYSLTSDKDILTCCLSYLSSHGLV